MHHPRADLQKLYVKRKNGGRGLLEVWSVHQQAVLGLSEYIESENSRLIQIVKLNDSLKKKYSFLKEASKIQNKYKLKKNNENDRWINKKDASGKIGRNKKKAPTWTVPEEYGKGRN